MTTRKEFMDEAEFHMSVDGRFRPVITGVLHDWDGSVLIMLAQHVSIDQLANAIKFCALGEGTFGDEIRFKKTTGIHPAFLLDHFQY